MDGEYVLSGGTPDKTVANIANCPSKYTNTSTDSVVTPNVATIWCSYNTSVPELAMTVCR